MELNRPDKRNALDETPGRVLQVFTDAAHDKKGARVIDRCWLLCRWRPLRFERGGRPSFAPTATS